MAYQNLEPVSKQLTIVVGLTVVGFMAFGLALSVYRNILFEETLHTIERENDSLQAEIDHSQEMLAYYQSAQFKDKYAKENLGRLNAGEKIQIIEEGAGVNLPLSAEGLSDDEAKDVIFQEQLRQMPAYLHWKLFLFERDKIEELRQGLAY